jgi:hypothetical protein
VTRTTAASVGATTARRNPNLVRKAPAVAINYQYLRRDMVRLAILAPSMIVLLLLAFVLLH